MSLCRQSGIKAATLKQLIGFVYFLQFFKCVAERREGNSAAAAAAVEM